LEFIQDAFLQQNFNICEQYGAYTGAAFSAQYFLFYCVLEQYFTRIGITLQGLAASRFFKEIYCTDSIYSVYKDKLQNCCFNQYDQIFTLWYKWNWEMCIYRVGHKDLPHFEEV